MYLCSPIRTVCLLASIAMAGIPVYSDARPVTVLPDLSHRGSSLPLHRAAQNGDWPQLGFDSGHSGFNPNETTIGTNNVATLQQAWSFPTGSGNNAGNVVEAAGIVYAPSANGELFALDAASGTPLWNFASGSGYNSSGSAPAVDAGLLFTVCNTSASTQGICALNAANGTPAWSYTFPGSNAYDGTPPVVAYGSVFFEACATSCAYLALNEQTGAVKWTVNEPQGSCEGNGGVTPAAAYKLLYVEFACQATHGQLVALHVKNGTTKWAVDDAPQNAGLSVARNIAAIVFQIPSPPRQVLFAYNAKKGDGKWEAEGGPRPGNTPLLPVITKNFVYLTYSSASFDGVLGWTTGRGKIALITSPSMPVSSSPSVANGVLYTACAGTPCAFNANTGAFLWGPQPSGTPTYGVPIVANGTLYAACEGNNVCAWITQASQRKRR